MFQHSDTLHQLVQHVAPVQHGVPCLSFSRCWPDRSKSKFSDRSAHRLRSCCFPRFRNSLVTRAVGAAKRPLPSNSIQPVQPPLPVCCLVEAGEFSQVWRRLLRGKRVPWSPGTQINYARFPAHALEHPDIDGEGQHTEIMTVVLQMPHVSVVHRRVPRSLMQRLHDGGSIGSSIRCAGGGLLRRA